MGILAILWEVNDGENIKFCQSLEEEEQAAQPEWEKQLTETQPSPLDPEDELAPAIVQWVRSGMQRRWAHRGGSVSHSH